MGNVMKKVPVREQDPKKRAANFEEVCLGYNQEEAMEEAARCLNCKNAKCVQGLSLIHILKTLLFISGKCMSVQEPVLSLP